MKPSVLLQVAFLLTAPSLFQEPQSRVHYTVSAMNRVASEQVQSNASVFAQRFTQKPDSEGFPSPAAWHHAPALRFNSDWRGKNADPERATEVRLLWTPQTLYLRFDCKYRTVTAFTDARADGRRDKLWERDVAETFLQPDPSDLLVYKEFEVSPNGYWLDLAVSHGEIQDLRSGLHRRVVLDEKERTWIAELALPMKCLTTRFDPQRAWRANFFRIEGEKEPRFYAAWSPTNSAKPNFHVPEAFGTIAFQE